MISAPWRPDAADLAEFLRGRGLRIGVGEILRANGVLDRLAALGRAPATPREAARFLSPLLCSSLRHQEALPAWLEEFDAGRKRGPIVDDEPGPGGGAGQPDPPISRMILVAASIVLALILLVALLLPNVPIGLDRSGGRTTMLATLTEWASGSRVMLSVVPLLLVPPLLTAAFLFWRGPGVPVMRRGPYAGGKLSKLKTGGAGGAGLFGGKEVRDAMRGLRVHRRVPSRRIDPRATVRATVQRAGHTALVTAQSNRAPEYPVLVHAISDRDHLVFLADSFCERLEEEGVHHVRFRFSTDPRFVWDASGATASLAGLAARFGGDVLLLVGDGSPLVDPITLKPYPWTEIFGEWRATVLLTPLPRARWSWRERRLAEAGIIVLPATSEGLTLLGGFLAGESRPPRLPLQRRPASAGLLTREGLHAYRFHNDAVPNPAECEEIVDAIVQDVPRSAIEVLAIAALFPEARPDLTHYLGRTVRPSLGGTFGEEDFGALCTLPWLRYGRLPDWLRLALVKTLGPAREEEGRRLLPAWVGSEPDAGGLSVAGDDGGQPAVTEDIQDVIYLRLLRNEPLGTLELEASGDLERLAGSRGRGNWWWIAAGIILADAALVAAALLALPRQSNGIFSFVVGDVSLALSVIAGVARLLAVSKTVARRCGSASLLLAAAGLLAIAPTWLSETRGWPDLWMISGWVVAPVLALHKPDGNADPGLPAARLNTNALAILWIVLLTTMAGVLPDVFMAKGSGPLSSMPVLSAVSAMIAAHCLTVVSTGSWVKRSIAAVVGVAGAVQILTVLQIPYAIFGIEGGRLIDAVAFPMLSVMPLLFGFLAATGRFARAARIPLATATGCVLLATLVIMAGAAWIDRTALNAAAAALASIAFGLLSAFSIRKDRPVFIKAAGAATIIVAVLVATSHMPAALHPLALVLGIASVYLVVLRARPGPQTLATFAMWFVTLDWYSGWVAPTGLGLVLQPVYIVAAAACGIRFGAAGLPAVLLGSLPLTLATDIPFWELHCRGNIDLLLAGLLVFAVATRRDRPRWLSAFARLGAPELALVSVITAIGSVAVAGNLIAFPDLDGAFPALFVLTHAGLTMLVAATSADMRRWLSIAAGCPAATAAAIVGLRHAVPAGPDWSLHAVLLAPLWFLVAGAMLAASLRREATSATAASTVIYLAELAILVALVRAGYVTSGAMFALIGALAADQGRRPRSALRVVWGGHTIPGVGGIANAVLVGLSVAFLSGLRWEGAAAFAVALLAALAPRAAEMPVSMATGRFGVERLIHAGSALLPSVLAGRLARSDAPVGDTASPPRNASTAAPVLLWVDDRPENNGAEQKILSASGVTVVLRETTEDALAWLAANRCNCIISDMGRREGPREGYALLEAVRSSGNETPLVFYTRNVTAEHRQETRDHGGQGCTDRSEELLAMINSILQAMPKNYAR